MGKHPHVRARWSVWPAFLLLVIGLTAGLALGTHSRNPMPASPSPGTRTLDLAAMALTPVDLDDIGLTGFGQQTSMFLDLREQAEQLADAGVVGPGMDTEAVVSGLNAAGFQRRYQRQLGLPPRPGASPPSSAPSSHPMSSNMRRSKAPPPDSPSSRPRPLMWA